MLVFIALLAVISRDLSRLSNRPSHIEIKGACSEEHAPFVIKV